MIRPGDRVVALGDRQLRVTLDGRPIGVIEINIHRWNDGRTDYPWVIELLGYDSPHTSIIEAQWVEYDLPPDGPVTIKIMAWRPLPEQESQEAP